MNDTKTNVDDEANQEEEETLGEIPNFFYLCINEFILKNLYPNKTLDFVWTYVPKSRKKMGGKKLQIHATGVFRQMPLDIFNLMDVLKLFRS